MTDPVSILKTDEEIMESYKLGNYKAFEILYERYSSKIFGFFYTKTGSQQAAEDLFQQVFSKLHQKRSLYDKKFLFINWIFSIAKNTLIDHYRKTNREKNKIQNFNDEQRAQTSDVELSPDHSESFDSSILTHYKTLGLSEKQLQVLKLKYQSDLSSHAIAEIINSSPTNVRQILSRSIAKIRSNFNKLKGLKHEQ